MYIEDPKITAHRACSNAITLAEDQDAARAKNMNVKPSQCNFNGLGNGKQTTDPPAGCDPRRFWRGRGRRGRVGGDGRNQEDLVPSGEWQRGPVQQVLSPSTRPSLPPASTFPSIRHLQSPWPEPWQPPRPPFLARQMPSRTARPLQASLYALCPPPCTHQPSFVRSSRSPCSRVAGALPLAPKLHSSLHLRMAANSPTLGCNRGKQGSAIWRSPGSLQPHLRRLASPFLPGPSVPNTAVALLFAAVFTCRVL